MKRLGVVIAVALAATTACGTRPADRVAARSFVPAAAIAGAHEFGAAVHVRPHVVPVHRKPAPMPLPPAPGCPVATPRVHFSAPEAAMRYLAWAWNAGYRNGLCQVTTPAARAALDAMHAEAVNLRFTHCDREMGSSRYDCYFAHDYPASMHLHGHGGAAVIVEPADNPGWYMSDVIGCG